jgi:hypothetical protein
MRRKRGGLWVDLLLVAMLWLAALVNFWRISVEGSSAARMTAAIAFAVGGFIWLVVVLARGKADSTEID